MKNLTFFLIFCIFIFSCKPDEMPIPDYTEESAIFYDIRLASDVVVLDDNFYFFGEKNDTMYFTKISVKGEVHFIEKLKNFFPQKPQNFDSLQQFTFSISPTNNFVIVFKYNGIANLLHISPQGKLLTSFSPSFFIPDSSCYLGFLGINSAGNSVVIYLGENYLGEKIFHYEEYNPSGQMKNFYEWSLPANKNLISGVFQLANDNLIFLAQESNNEIDSFFTFVYSVNGNLLHKDYFYNVKTNSYNFYLNKINQTSNNLCFVNVFFQISTGGLENFFLCLNKNGELLWGNIKKPKELTNTILLFGTENPNNHLYYLLSSELNFDSEDFSWYDIYLKRNVRSTFHIVDGNGQTIRENMVQPMRTVNAAIHFSQNGNVTILSAKTLYERFYNIMLTKLDSTGNLLTK